MSNLKNYLFTSESVSEGHPDKVCDRISDMVVDTYLGAEAQSRVACETLTTTNKVVLAGEVRGPEAATLLMAMNTGHDGSFGSLHANTANETVKRLVNPPMAVPAIMLSALDLIIMQARLNVGGKNIRRITEVAEIAGMEGDTPRLNPIWKYDAGQGKIVETGVPSKVREIICAAKGCTPADFEAIVRQKEQILTDLVNREIRDIESVTRVIQTYHATVN